MAHKIIPIGPYHPLQEEPEFFKLHVDGETVVCYRGFFPAAGSQAY